MAACGQGVDDRPADGSGAEDDRPFEPAGRVGGVGGVADEVSGVGGTWELLVVVAVSVREPNSVWTSSKSIQCSEIK